MRRSVPFVCLSTALGLLCAGACSSDSKSGAAPGEGAGRDASTGGTEADGQVGGGSGQGGRGNGGGIGPGGSSGAGTDAGATCLPQDQVPKPTVLGVSAEDSCSMPTGACASPLDDTKWRLSDVCLDAGTLFPQAAARCSSVTFGSVVTSAVHGSASFSGSSVELDLAVDATVFLDFPNSCHFCRCSDLETELLSAGMTDVSCSPVCNGGTCSCTASTSQTLTVASTYAFGNGTFTSGTVSLNACAAEDALSLQDPETHTVFTLRPPSVVDTPEICDGKDDDGNGKVDDDPVECPPCKTVGVCGEGVNPTCSGTWTCNYTSPAWEEQETTCDHLDNDCNGQVDENLPCREVCDGKDNDGNGKVDDDPLDSPTCTQVGVCQGATGACGGANGWVCTKSTDFEAAETKCDGKDNDCDGAVDEHCCAADAARVYYSYQAIGDSGVQGVVIARSKLDGSGSETLVTEPSGYWIDVSVDPVGKKIYWASLLDDTIRRSNLDGSNAEVALTGDNQPRLALDVAHRWIFWRGNGGVNRTNLDDLSKTDPVLPGQLPMTMTVDTQDGWLFLADASSVSRANLDGSGLVTVTDQVGYLIEGMAFDPVGRKLYWTAGALFRADPDLSGVESLFSLNYPVELHTAAAARRLYWSETTGNRIGWTSIAGATPTAPTYVDYPDEVICGEVVDCPP